MSGDGDDIDPTSPRPKGHYGRFRDLLWYCVSDKLAQIFILRPATDVEPGDDWILPSAGESVTGAGHERACARLAPRALHELYTEAKDLLPDARQTGYTVKCDLCGGSVPLEKTVPNKREGPAHKRCYIDAYGGSTWMKDY